MEPLAPQLFPCFQVSYFPLLKHKIMSIWFNHYVSASNDVQMMNG
jgi:hypothetical protein